MATLTPPNKMKPFITNTLAGTPLAGNVDSIYTQSQFSRPTGLLLMNGFIFVTDRSVPSSVRVLFNNKVKSIKWRNSQELLQAGGMCFHANCLFIADRGHDKIRYIQLPENLNEKWFFGLDNAKYELQTLLCPKLKKPSYLLTYQDSLIISDSGNSRVCQLQLKQPFINTNYLSLDILFQAQKPEGMCFYRDGVLVCDSLSHLIYYYSFINKKAEVFAGTEIGLENGDLKKAKFRAPCFVKHVDGFVYVSERDNSCIREIYAGQIRTIGGGTVRGYCDGVQEISQFNEPSDFIVKKNTYFTQILIADTKNACIRELVNTGFQEKDMTIVESGVEIDVQQSQKSQNNSINNIINQSVNQKINNNENLRFGNNSLKNQNQVNINDQIVQDENLVEKDVQNDINDEDKLDNTDFEKIIQNQQTVQKENEQAMNYKIEPYSTLNSLLSYSNINPLQFFRLFSAIPFDADQLLQFLLQHNINNFIPVAFGYLKYYKLISNNNCNIDKLSDAQYKNIQTLRFFRHLLNYQLLNYSPILFKRLILQTQQHSALLAIVNFNCVKLRILINKQVLQINNNNQYLLSSINFDKQQPKALIEYEIQITSLIKHFENLNCKVQFTSGLVSNSQIKYLKGQQHQFQNQDVTIFFDKLSFNVPGQFVEQYQKAGVSECVQIIEIEVWDKYKLKIGVEFGSGSIKKSNTDIGRVFALEQTMCGVFV